MIAGTEASGAALRAYAVELYGRDGVPGACLSLQDDCGLDVSVVLFAAWMGAARGRRLGVADLTAAGDHVSPWREEVVEPLRAVRRTMKLMRSPPAGSEAVRGKVKAAELDAELVELDALEAFADALGEAAPAGPGLAAANLRAAIADLPGAKAGAGSAAVAAIADACAAPHPARSGSSGAIP